MPFIFSPTLHIIMYYNNIIHPILIINILSQCLKFVSKHIPETLEKFSDFLCTKYFIKQFTRSRLLGEKEKVWSCDLNLKLFLLWKRRNGMSLEKKPSNQVNFSEICAIVHIILVISLEGFQILYKGNFKNFQFLYTKSNFRPPKTSL